MMYIFSKKIPGNINWSDLPVILKILYMYMINPISLRLVTFRYMFVAG